MVLETCSRSWLSIAVIACLSGIAFGEAISRMTAPEIEHALDVSILFDLRFRLLISSSNALLFKSSIISEKQARRLPPASPSKSLTHCSHTGRQSMRYSLLLTSPVPQVRTQAGAVRDPTMLNLIDFLLALCPPNIDPSSLSVMVAFAVGGLLGDTIFHLLPEIFLGEAAPDHARFVLVDTNKNILLGVAIIVGFLTFTAMDKILRIATGGGGHDHSHEKKPPNAEELKDVATKALATGVEKKSANGSVRSRKAPVEAPKDLTIYSAIDSLTLSTYQLSQLWMLPEPARSNRWLSEALQEDEEGGVTQIAIWKAYEAAFKSNQSTKMLEATVMIHNASKVFDNASAQIIGEGKEKKFIIKGVRPRTTPKEEESKSEDKSQSLIKAENTVSAQGGSSPSIRLSAYLNLIADFTHNITDGLAISSSFYASPTLGATTTVAVFFHEIPHEVGDFALLIQSGFSKRKAMGAQFVTALGAFLGTCLGIAVQELGKEDSLRQKGSLSAAESSRGFFGTGLSWGDMLLPFTAGTFLYVGTVAVIPELLETGPKKSEEVKKTLTQFIAMLFGAGIMLA